MSGVETPPFQMVRVDSFARLPEGIPTGDGDVFLIERFDRRPAGTRIHMEDFGQVLDRPPGLPQYRGSYEEIGVVTATIAASDAQALCERIAFAAVSGNGDAHLKNWTVLYPDGRRARLSPAYDLVATVVYPTVEDQLALELSSSKRFEDVTEHSFDALADVMGHERDEVRRWAREMAGRARAIFVDQAARWPLTAQERGRIEQHLSRVPLGR